MRALALLCALTALGCRSEARERKPRVDASAADGGAREEWFCGAIRDARVVERRANAGPLRIGLVADTKEPLPATLQNLERFAQAFAKEKVQAVIALGGLGSTEEEIARVLAPLAKANAPVLALPGDREPEGAFHDAVKRARASGADVIDLADARAVVLTGALAIVSLPGVRFPSYLGARANGCRYRKQDVAALKDVIAKLPPLPRLLVAHTPPRGEGPNAIDWALGGANVGDRDLAPILSELAPWGAFAHVDEAGGRATDGSAPVAEQAWSDRLYVNAGAADSVPHDLDAGGLARGQAALLEIADGKARYRVLR